MNVRVRENGRWSKRTDVRLLSLQAMELTDYSRAHGRRGECHAVAAAERLEFLLQGRRVKRRKARLAAFRASSRTAGACGRLRPGIAFRTNGSSRDAGAVLTRAGHVLWDPHGRSGDTAEQLDPGPGRQRHARCGPFSGGQLDPVFENIKRGRRGIGDGAYLFDPQGDLRAWRMYPCHGTCSGPPRDA